MGRPFYSVAVSAETSLRSPRKLFIVNIKEYIYIYKLESVPGDQNLTFLCKIVPKAKIKNKICKLTPEDVLRTIASLGSG